MTGIIFRGLKNNTFNVFKFYQSRAIRIIPGLSALCLFLLIFGWFYLTPEDYDILGKHISYSIVFLSNKLYMKELGYFDPGSYQKWLLQTWSLSVEWQFYLVYPLFLLFLKRFISIKYIKPLVIVIAVLSYSVSIFLTLQEPDKAYFSFWARIWEMLVGGLAYLYPPSSSFFSHVKNTYPLFKNVINKKVLGIAGLLCIVMSYLFYSKNSGWPGFIAALPVAGAYLIIMANNQGSFISRSVTCQKIGKWSYSIYLWHWPIAVYFHMSPFNEWQYSFIGIFLSFCLGFLSFKYIENFRFGGSDYKRPYLFPVVIVLIIFVTGKIITHYDGFNNNSTLVSNLDKRLKYPRYCHVDGRNVKESDSYLNCKLGNKKVEPKGLLWGDSYAGHLDPFVSNVVPVDSSFISRSTSMCFPALNSDSMLGDPLTASYCSRVRKTVKDELRSGKYNVVFMAGRWDAAILGFGERSTEAIFEAIRFASKNAKLVYVFSQPVYYKVPVLPTFLRTKISTIFRLTIDRKDEMASMSNFKIEDYIKRSKFGNVVFIDRNILYGSNEISDYSDDGLPFTFDEGHLSEYGSVKFAENFKKSKEYTRFTKTILDI